MGFLSDLTRLFMSAIDPTLAWSGDDDLRLIVDLDRQALCGVTVGQPQDALAALGRAEQFDPLAWYNVSYPARGIYLRLHAGKLDEFHLVWDEQGGGTPASPSFRPFAGTITWRGLAAPIHGRLDAESWLRIFPEPESDSQRSEEEGDALDQPGRVLEYNFADDSFGWEVIFNRQMQLAALTITDFGSE